MHRTVLRSFAILTFAASTIALGSANAGPTKRTVAGNYTATIEGTELVLTLEANGTGTLGDERGRWRVSGKTIVVIDSDGQTIKGQVVRGALIFSLDGQTVRFTKAKSFAPSLLAGTIVRPKGGDGSFRVPRGWKHAWGQGPDGSDAYNVTDRKGTLRISVGRTQLKAAESSAPVKALLEAALSELVDGASLERELPAESFRVGGRRAGRVIVRADGSELEAYLGAVITKNWAYSVLALYRTTDRKRARAAADTVLATLRVKPPKPPKQKPAKSPSRLARCWFHKSVTSGSGEKTKLRLFANGTFERISQITVVGYGGMGGTSQESSSGTWSTSGSTLTLSSTGGGVTRYRFDYGSNGRLLLDNKGYGSC